MQEQNEPHFRGPAHCLFQRSEYHSGQRDFRGFQARASMSKQKTFQAMALGLVLVSGAADAGLFSKKKPAPPPPPPEPVVVVPVEPPTPPAPIPLEFSGSKTAPPTQASLDRLLSASPEVQATAQWI